MVFIQPVLGAASCSAGRPQLVFFINARPAAPP